MRPSSRELINNGSMVAFDRNLNFSNQNINISCKNCELKDRQINDLIKKVQDLSAQQVKNRVVISRSQI